MPILMIMVMIKDLAIKKNREPAKKLVGQAAVTIYKIYALHFTFYVFHALSKQI